jgi:hypothetical protein
VLADIWGASHFDVPVLGLTGVSGGQIIVAPRALFGDSSTVNRELFTLALTATGVEALGLWSSLSAGGDGMAHFALGYSCMSSGATGRPTGIRHYTEIAPHCSWNWCWYGKAARRSGCLLRRARRTSARSRWRRPATKRPTRASCSARRR